MWLGFAWQLIQVSCDIPRAFCHARHVTSVQDGDDDDDNDDEDDDDNDNDVTIYLLSCYETITYGSL